jgi:hypothetical protein
VVVVVVVVPGSDGGVVVVVVVPGSSAFFSFLSLQAVKRINNAITGSNFFMLMVLGFKKMVGKPSSFFYPDCFFTPILIGRYLLLIDR